MSHEIITHNMLNICSRAAVLTFKGVCDCNLRGTSAGSRYYCRNTLHLVRIINKYVLDLVEMMADLLLWVLRSIFHLDSHAYSLSNSDSRRSMSSKPLGLRV